MRTSAADIGRIDGCVMSPRIGGSARTAPTDGLADRPRRISTLASHYRNFKAHAAQLGSASPSKIEPSEPSVVSLRAHRMAIYSQYPQEPVARIGW
jgi:hypothetical protein